MMKTSKWWVVLALGCAGGGDGDGSGGTTDTSLTTATGSPTTGSTDNAPTTTTAETGTGATLTGTEPPTTLTDPPTTLTDPSTTTDPPTTMTEPPPTTMTEPPDTDTTPPGTCNDNPVCLGAGSCGECAISQDCAAQFTACMNTPDDECEKYASCTGTCNGNGPCINTCAVLYPNGYDPSWAQFDCTICDACSNSCSPAFPGYCDGPGGGPGKVDSCDQVGDCAACTLCSTLTPDCSVEAQDCNANPECQQYQTCVQGCAQGDFNCTNSCYNMFPDGYDLAWTSFDCAVCFACPATCAVLVPNCGGPAECATDAHCDFAYPNENLSCVDGYCE